MGDTCVAAAEAKWGSKQQLDKMRAFTALEGASA
jgi:hypothetical protein